MSTPEQPTTSAVSPSLLQGLNKLGKLTDLAVPLGILMILVLLLVPLPTWILDISLALSLGFAIFILIVVMLIANPIEINAFPTILLIATMLRLGLNVASTRLILSRGHEGTDAAGRVIQAFGGFVAGNNYVIGVIIFAILVIINFIVITRGAGRIAEVAARFTLDAMPGRQMAIDADLSSGLIPEEQARERRRELETEGNFYGAMDGASKFVRGDAIAGLLITLINIIGGMIIGIVQQGLSAGEAAQNYTVLTIGDGLVSQLPALIVSTAAGLLVTKTGSRETMQKALYGQLSKHPYALWMVSGVMLMFGFIPGLPILPFALMSSLAAAAALYLMREQQGADVATAQEKEKAEEIKETDEDDIEKTLRIDIIRLEIGYGLLALIREDEDMPQLPRQIRALRRQLILDYGFVTPAIRIQDNLKLSANSYIVLVKEMISAKADLRANMVLAMSPQGEEIAIAGEKTIDPIFNLPAKWIPEQAREDAMFQGLTVVNTATILTTHLAEVIKDHMAELLSYSETQRLVDSLPEGQRKFVADIVPQVVSVSLLHRVLQGLLSERVSIRDLATVIEATSEVSSGNEVAPIIEHVRTRLARQICTAYLDKKQQLPIVSFSAQWNRQFLEALGGEGKNRQLALPPSRLQDFITKLRHIYDAYPFGEPLPVLVVAPILRPYVRSIIERAKPQIAVLSQTEIHPRITLRTVAQI